MSFHNRLLWNRAAISGLRTLEVMLLVDVDAHAQIGALVTRIGGEVRREDATIGYMRVRIPTERLLELVADTRIATYQIASYSRGAWYRDGAPQGNAEMFRGFERAVPARKTTAATESTLPVLSLEQSRQSGYTADDDVGVSAWLKEHPTFDGRGVTIALLESAQIEFSHPVLAPALSLDGHEVPKIAGILNTIDLDAPDDSRVMMNSTVHAATAWARVGDRTYILPRPGDYRLGVFVLPLATNVMQQFAVLENLQTRDIWVDTNGDASFQDETPIADVNERFDVRVLKFDYPQPSDLSFVMSRGRAPNIVHLYVAQGSHHMMTTSVAAGSKTADSLAYGVAPSARVLLVRCQSTDYDVFAFLEGYLEAAQRPDVDVLSDSIGVTTPSDTGAEFFGMFFHRLNAAFRKPIFHASGNMHLYLNSASSFGDTFSVGGSMGAATRTALLGDGPAERLMLHNIGAAGPSIDGSLKPDFLAPMQRIAATLYSDPELQVPRRKPSIRLPPGYQTSCCTSASSPYAAGVGALLVSAARQEHLTYTFAAFGRALRVGARFLEGTSSHEQGNGVLDVNAAWRELQRPVEIPVIEASSTIHHALAPYAARGQHGEGLFEREGWSAGMTGRREFTFIRSSGPSGPIVYRISWTGNDGTFTAPSSIALPLGSLASLPVEIAVREGGAHSAILNLHDPESDAIIFRTQAAIVASARVERQNPLRITQSLPFGRAISHYLTIPKQVNALELTLDVHHGSITAAILPSHSLYPNYYDHLYPASGRTFTPGTYHLMLPNPVPGVWSLSVHNAGSAFPQNQLLLTGETAEYTITARAMAAGLRVHEVGSSRTVIDIDNLANSVREPVLEASIGAIRSHTAEILSNGLPNQFEILVPEQADELVLQLRNAGAAANTLELYLYDCTSGECFSYDFTLPAGVEQTLTVRKPKPGRWVAAVNAAPFPAQSGRFVLDEIITANPQRHAPTAPSHERPYGSRWTVTVDHPVASSIAPDSVPIVMYELLDAQINREEEEHPWETRVDLGLVNLAGRRPTVGRAIVRLK